MPEIRHFAVAGNGNGQLVIAAIAGPGPDDQQFTPDVWLAQEVSDDIGNPWPAAWRSLGAPADGHQLDGIAMASNVSGGLEIAVTARNQTVWHNRQDDADADWSGWASLGNPVSGGSTIAPPALTQNQDGRLELFTLSLIPRPAVWHRSQLRPGQDQWTGWSSLGVPAGGSQFTAAAPAVAQNQDGRLEVHLRVNGQIWHAWQKTAGSHDWVPWTSLGQPEGRGPVGLPTVALDVDGLLQVFTTSGPDIWMREQHAPGHGPWESWEALGAQGRTGEPALAVAAQGGGRLVVFALRNLPDGTQSLEKLEEEGGAEGQWLAGDPLGIGLLGKPDVVPKADNPALASGGRERLRLFLSVPGRIGFYIVNQASEAGGEWEDSFHNFRAP